MDVAAKLQLKLGQTLHVNNLPDGVTFDLPNPPADPRNADAVLVFVRNASVLDTVASPAIAAARRDALAWIAYPKAGKLGTDLSRDSLWQLLKGKGIRPVRQVALDDTWSALRFRPE